VQNPAGACYNHGNMKIIALIPLKNEDWILKTTIPQMKKYANEILCLDAGSTDGTLAYLKTAGENVFVKRQTEETDSYYIEGIREFFNEKGILYFEPIQLWHVPELKKIFLNEIGREPIIKTYPAWVVGMKKFLDRIKKTF
jgi:hypothetical protein